jgi:hypothetical protein
LRYVIVAAAFIAAGCAVAQAQDRVTYDSAGRPTTINGHIQPPGLEPGGGGTIARCVPGYITRDPSCASTSASPKARRARR